MNNLTDDGLESLADQLMYRRLGWYRHVNEESGVTAMFPLSPVFKSASQWRQVEDEWEQRAIEQTRIAEKQTIACRIPDKQIVNELNARRARMTRGD